MAIEESGPAAGPPSTLRAAVRAELSRTLRPPYETPIVVAVNGAIMSSAWVILPTDLTDKLFSLHGSLAFALVLAAWMYSDVPATNVLGPDARRVIAAIDDPAQLRRILFAKNVVLWTLVTPVCLIVSLVTGVLSGNLLSTLYSIIWIGFVPFGVLAISGWVGIILPYHPMPLRFRWGHRRPVWRMLGRWLALVVTPYGLVPFLGMLLMTPSLLLWGLTSPQGLSQKLPDHDLGVGVALACAVSLVCAVGGHRIATWMVRRRRAELLSFLEDPTRG